MTLTVITALSASAQCTADPQFTEPGIYPDSATGLTPACADQAYEQLITIIVPVDTTAMIGPFPITLPFDSVVVSSWTGLPPGFTYACSSPDNVTSPVNGCAYEGGVTGCAVITGNPTMADIGSYQQIITTDAYLQGNPMGNPTTVVVDYYYIQIVDCGLGINALTNSKFMVYPNPAKSVITLNGLNGIDVESVVVKDMSGKVMAFYDGITSAALDMNIDHLSNGMYFVQVNFNGINEVIKFVKE